MALEAASFAGDRLSRRQMRYHLSNRHARMWVCTDERDAPVASLLGLFHRNRPARIYSVATDAAWRGRGMGERMMREFLREAARRGSARAVLEVRVDSASAIRLYERIGFTFLRHLPGYYEDGADGVKMEMKL